MSDRSSLPQGERGAELLLEHCGSLTWATPEGRAPAFLRLEQAVGGDLARLLVGALSAHRRDRLTAV